jgi:mono/diheme cytochrome c family protein
MTHPTGRRRMPRPRLLAALAAAAFCGLAAPGDAAAQAPPAAAPAPAPAPTTTPAAAAPAQPSAVERGAYLALAADCMPCHTAPGGRPFAGGRALNTPFGTLVSPNITPDVATGIGGWTDDQFWRALHDGIGKKGEDLYPVMPFTSYTLMTREDALAIKAWLDTQPAVHAPRQPNGLAFPFNIRATLGFWRELYFRPRTFQPDPAKTAEWNRGAYLVTALAHCGECHTPRNLLGAMESSRALTGAVVDGWFAPNLRPDLRQGKDGWTVDQMTAWLRTGASATKGTVFGPMQEVVHDSLSKLTEADVRAIAVYLTQSPPQRQQHASAAPAADPHAGALYLQNCGGCHQPGGRGIPSAIPPLADNPAVQAAQPNNVIQAVLNGVPGQGTWARMPSFAAALDDAQIASIANYVRTAWGSSGGNAATPELVAQLRRNAAVTAAGTEAARRLCPAISPVGAPDALSPLMPGALSLMQSAESMGDLANRTDVLMQTMRRTHPGISDALLADALIGAYCPAVANDPSLTDDQRRARLQSFTAAVAARMATAMQSTDPVVVSTTLPPNALAQAQAAARAAGMTLDAWLARVATQQAAQPQPAR